jgi:hypothetical protein
MSRAKSVKSQNFSKNLHFNAYKIKIYEFTFIFFEVNPTKSHKIILKIRVLNFFLKQKPLHVVDFQRKFFYISP